MHGTILVLSASRKNKKGKMPNMLWMILRQSGIVSPSCYHRCPEALQPSENMHIVLQTVRAKVPHSNTGNPHQSCHPAGSALSPAQSLLSKGQRRPRKAQIIQEEEKRKLQRDLIAAFWYLNGAYKDAREWHFIRKCSDRTRGNGFKPRVYVD